MNAHQVGTKLVELCRAGRFLEAIETLYADDVVSVEPVSDHGGDAVQTGKDAAINKNKWWDSAHDVHSVKLEGPFPHGEDRFAVYFEMDVTPKEGPMTGKRFTMQEVGLYTVAGGRVAREEFFYSMC